MENSINLKAESIMQVPFKNYQNDFTFIVNSEKFETSTIVADLISPLISQQRLSDPTIHEFLITTESKGDFRTVLNLINFAKISISENNLPFIIEVFEQLGTKNIDFVIQSNINQEITSDTVLSHIKLHQRHSFFYKNQLQKEIDFISKNFSSMKERLIEFITKEEKCLDLIESVINNDNLQLENEDELLDTINSLYIKNSQFSVLYKYVKFANVEVSSIEKFLEYFNFNDLTSDVWTSISNRLRQKKLA